MDVETIPSDRLEGRIMKTRFKICLLVLALCLVLLPITSKAAASVSEMGQFPNVTLSPDGSERAWTTDLWDKTNEKLPRGYTVDMQVESRIGTLKEGQHYYGKQAEGSVRIGKWVVTHSPGQCIHDTPTKDTFAGFTYRNAICYSYYNNGWFAYCADCGELVAHMLIYARESTVRQITSMPASSIYVYQCPHCSHLEQGTSYQHYCKEISSNRYKITYRQNTPIDSTVTGYMAPTMHMYENSDMYNGQPANEIGYADRALRSNSFSCIGYVFMGWNTKADGSGISFTDGQEVLNLTTEDNGIVKLYAQWVKAEGSLLLDANGGTYNGLGVYTQTQKYGTSYEIDQGNLVPPKGYQVTFETNGGEAVQPITTTKCFTHWELQAGFSGEFKNNVYTYLGEDGYVDRIKAQYSNVSFKLPNCRRENVSLVGWYTDPSLEDDSFVGKPGDEITVDKNTILYAKWATLTLWAYDDYTSHDGTGAVDLTWEQKDGRSKYYLLYQSEDKNAWNEIFSGNDIQSSTSILKEYDTSDQGITYTIPYTGNYTMIACGAKGADYNSTFTGGKGGTVTVTYWFHKEDVLTVYPGTAGSGLHGGINGNGADGGTSTSDLGRGGGAATQIYLTRDNEKMLLITAGGGGGANGYASGGHGGSEGGNGTAVKGEDGIGAGGGGATGGLNGDYAYHTHSVEECGYHDHDGNAKTKGDCYATRQIVRYETQTADGGYCNTCGDTVWQGDGYLRYHESVGHDVDWEERVVGKKPVYGDYIFDCPYDVPKDAGGFLCGISDGTVTSASPSYGGSNYANVQFGAKDVVLQNGANDGAGKVTIVSKDIGYLEENSLADVPAKDKAAPGDILVHTESLSGEDICRISIIRPKDYGTTYYHKAESYETDSIRKIATSNITENTLISGVAGYRYFLSGSKSGTVSGIHSFTSNDWIDVRMSTTIRYLHVAAVDVAGNIGATRHIPIKTLEKAPDIPPDPEYPKAVPLMTERIEITDTDYVYPAGEYSFYIKADGATEHMLNIVGYVDGKATNTYQVEWLQLVSLAGGRGEWYQNKIPRTDIRDGDKTYTNMQLKTDASVEEPSILMPTSAEAERTNEAARVSMLQRFVVSEGMDNRQIQVYPRALAALKDVTYSSDENRDKENAIILIPDGQAPTVTGVSELENAGNIDMTEESKEFVITAADFGSGVKAFEVTIINQDNQMMRTYSSEDGRLTITIDKDDYLFLGDFAVTARAVDHVGNESIQESEKLAFTLKADLQRARFPYNGNFKAGDGAVLTVTTGGYADKVVIRFPEELLMLNPDLDKEYVYEFPEAIKTEVYNFNIPLDTPSGNYVIEVEAWKNGRRLTEELELPIQTIGSIIEEFRTRIRDNGV